MKSIIEWLIKKFLKDYHLSHNPVRKAKEAKDAGGADS